MKITAHSCLENMLYEAIVQFKKAKETYDKASDEFFNKDERTGSEKRTKNRMLVQASTLSEAMQAVANNMRGTMADYEAVCIKETPILEYIQQKTIEN